MGVGHADGKDKAEQAAMMAISSPLLETSIKGARGVLVNVTGSADIGLDEVETCVSLVQQAAHPDANIIFGATFDESLSDELRVTVIATGFDQVSDDIFEEPAPVQEEAAAPVEEKPAAPAFEVPETNNDAYADIFKLFNSHK
jgi:cell division protein FtsZ